MGWLGPSKGGEPGEGAFSSEQGGGRKQLGQQEPGVQGRAEGGPLGEAAPSQPSLQVTKHSLYFIMGPNVDRAPAHCGTLDPSPPPLLGLAPLAATLTQSALINASPGTQRLAPPTPPPRPRPQGFSCSVIHPSPNVSAMRECFCLSGGCCSPSP